ncbi:histidine kinase [Ulvibacterium marinum]|uniref:histidine kinase n=1 Tax=Ulvibacterium marinum TaxID=2419782 RepID=UPI0024949080|nr:sensor histidine kinase [Ulvibacterium marinum]
MRKIITYSIILYALVFNVLNGQDYTIRDIEMNPNGKSHKYRNFMQIDADGFLWYSTNNGIVKDFETHSVLSSFLVENPSDLVQDIYGIYFDSKQRIWVSADTGLFVSGESQDDSFNRVELKPFLMGRELQPNSFMEDCQGNLWMVASNPQNNIILKVNPSLQVTEYQIEGIEPRYTNDRYFLRNFLYFERRLGCDTFLVRQGRKLYIFDAGTTTPIADYTPSIKYSWADYIYPEWPLNGGDGLVLTDNGDLLPESMEIKYTYEGEVFETYFIEDLDLQLINIPFQEMIPITEDANPILKNHADLIAINGPGKTLMLFKMVEINGSLHLKKTYEIPFPFLIEDLIIGKNEIIYVSSYDRIHKIKFSKRNFDRVLDNYEKLDMNARAFLELPDEKILAATNSGVFKLTPIDSSGYGKSHYKTENILPTLTTPFSFLKASDSTAWCLGESKGLLKINFHTNKLTEIYIFDAHWKLANLHYYDILKYSDSTLLLASLFGLQEFNFKQKRFRELPILPVENNRELFIRDLYRTSDKLYIGTDASGLFIQDLGSHTFLHLTNDSINKGLTLPTNKIYTVLTDQQENLWLGTDKGVIYFDKDLNKTTVINAKDGLTDLNVVGILEDAHKNMWFSTYDGLYRYEKDLKKVTAFYVEDGLPFNDFNQYAYYKTSTNTLLFGGVRGLIAFDSIDDKTQSQDLRIFPTKFEYYDIEKEKEVELDAQHKGRYDFDLPYSKNSFSITYTINDCYNTENNKYAYRLDGVTEDWVDLGNQTILKLFSIPPGDHVLRIRGSNPAGVESANELNYDIHVAQVFYKRPWIQAAALLFLLGLVALALYDHSKRERKKHELRLTLVELERKTLRAQMNPHFIFNALNGIRKTVKEGKLSKLDDYITNFSSLMRLTLDLTRNENILLAKEMRYIQNYVALTNTKSEHKIDLIIQCGPDIDMEDTFIPSMVLQPIVENSIVHGFTEDQREKSITIKIERSKRTGRLILTIEDNGIGISGAKNEATPNQGHQSYATQILHERLKLLNQIRQREFGYEITIKDIADKTRTGAIVIIKIPYEK